MADPLLLRFLRFVPKNLVSRGFGWLASRTRPRWLARPYMMWFARQFRIDLSEAELPVAEYDCLLALFTRRLKAGARPISDSPDTLVNPVDGRVGAYGRIKGERLFQAKGMEYTLEALLGSSERADEFRDGAYATLYLSPKDYHRIHTPEAGGLVRTLYEPGTLWPVNPPAVRNVPRLFAVNERATSILKTPRGPIAVVMVGATNVGRIRLAYQDFTTNRPGQSAFDRPHDPPLPMGRGDHLATFELGSTVVLLVGSPGFTWENLQEGEWMPMGSPLGNFSGD